MAASYTTDQVAKVTALAQKCTTLKAAIRDALALRQEMLDLGYGQGGANQLTDATTNSVYPDINAVDVLNAFTAIVALDTQLSATSRQQWGYLERMAK